MSAATETEVREFQTEVSQLLDLMIHALYSNKEIFLRELISNASDANDKLRFAGLSDDSLFEGDSELTIKLEFDKEAGTFSIMDNGIGMSRDEVISNIGTIAKSGTKEFFKSLTGDQQRDAHLIGQFGVGFYSSFIVADKVTLETRKAGAGAEQGVRWISAGDGSYTLENMEKAERGTRITLHMREDEKEFLDAWRLRSIVRKFSDHVTWPVKMLEELPPAPPAKEGEEPEPPKTPEWETVNKASALWTLSKNDITEDEYKEFYKHVGHDFEDPMEWVHARMEGRMEYTLLLYIPGRAPFDLWDRDRRGGLKLFVRRVFIMDTSEELLPRYLRFVRGVIDSADLPLNVSREILQQNRQVEAIKKGLVHKVLGMLEEMLKNDPEKYATFWKEFGMVLKEGMIEDFANKERIAKLCRFSTTHDGERVPKIALADYVERMKEGQEAIYYVTGESFEACSSSPHLEIFRKKGIEVLLLSDRVDEWTVTHLTEFDGKPLQAITKGELDLSKFAGGEEEAKDEEAEKAQEEALKPITERMAKVLEGQVKEVRLSHRLTESPACLVGDAHDMSATLERLLKEAGQEVPTAKRILEINPSHALLKRLADEADEEKFGELTHVLHDQALLAEGGQLKDPSQFVKRLNKLLMG
ncbi:heat shock protein Hsp90 [Magnetococcus marinus MC-1]|uniref:Chaperone protein HtpG n=1 Tax=Magnetococcus marinus (strain ATCC BAA-1437 / JCM 17883 / MC-1) TaxID=156889 RepID=HTPG_MAGMM|nr:molecular chaperone HtpG [Magnetococcus marinus]A0L8B0.1 RecName: Full=Chaperone protein HtpG; AltName: Full=Heat shock protein HtpG; AltName: Full=High temperature protein G [Magnetococcus marinus MC-1]ABK44203.1 heat shock protein Hsp90 [Magnetococcus marinus MC-1]